MNKLILVLTVAFSVHSAFARNPIGEKITYGLDKSSKRTSSLLKEGKLLGSAVGSYRDAEGRLFYNVNVDYDLNVFLVGHKTGTIGLSFPEEFFTEEFLVELRKTKHYEDSGMKIDYLGSHDATLITGEVFKNCDELLIYDLKQDTGQLENLEIKATISYGQPVIGAVKLDIETDFSSFHIRAGADKVK